jgi:uncharacterized protein YfbU (UPF0304 family)
VFLRRHHCALRFSLVETCLFILHELFKTRMASTQFSINFHKFGSVPGLPKFRRCIEVWLQAKADWKLSENFG